MNKLSLIALALVAASAASAVFADDITPDTTATQVFSVTKTRAQVEAERIQAKADGSSKVWSTSYNPLALAKSTRSREEVKGEFLAARSMGTEDVLLGEDSGSFYLAKQGSPKAAGPVLAGTASRSAQ